MRVGPQVAGNAPIRMDGETPLAAGVRIMPLIAAGVLPIQGPPWTLHQTWPQRRAAIRALRPKTCVPECPTLLLLDDEVSMSAFEGLSSVVV